MSQDVDASTPLRPPDTGRQQPDPLERIARELLLELGEDPEREGLLGTPARWARWWREFIRYEPGTLETVFESASSAETISVSGIEVWSLCEHHLLPFSCKVTVGYRPQGQVLGLSKFARIAHQHAHRLQLQERLTADIADTVAKLTASADVAVLCRGEHMCMAMRGIRTPATMTTVTWRGSFADPAVRAEFLALQPPSVTGTR
ncbi:MULTISPECIES: GTP cyclohydrolase I [unclassified Streptomyces]|uniref:GTP cyclohydrolase I n=1 Tax=unclassified Streptomyces TaxID=2593676 RepID=UPI00073B750D|nr:MULTISPECIES: GTP cyclohydrolase I [unclassified Streptomyces]ODA72679.1 GTP cyclohydrolase 1 [Streptomyces sp. AVP053U2]